MGKREPNAEGAADLAMHTHVGGRIKRLGIAVLSLVIGGTLLGLYASPAWADPSPPTTFLFESVQVCRHVVEEDDFVLAFHYNIHYDSEQPDDPANKLFTFRLLAANGIDHLGAVVPYAYYNSGYDQGCAAFYFPASDAPDWGGAYIVRISGNPEYFSSPPVASKTLVNSDYSQVETQKENQVILGNYILDIARDLEINWDTSLLYVSDLGTVLNSTGESYFRGAVPGLAVMAPQIFPIQIVSPEYEETEWQETQAKAYEERFKDTWVGKALVSLGDLFHVKWNVITGSLLLVAIIGMAVLCQWWYGTIKPVPIAGASLMLGGSVLGWIAPAIMAIVTIFTGGLFLGYVWIFRHG